MKIAKVFNSLRTGCIVARYQLTMSIRNVEDFLPVLVIPFGCFVSMAVILHLERPDLMLVPVTAGILMSIGHMAFFVGGEIVEADRGWQRFENLLITKSTYQLQLFSRIFILCTLGVIGALETLAIAKYWFQTPLVLKHPFILGTTVLATIFAASLTAILAAAIFSMGRTSRTFQSAFSGPLFLLSGVYVPVEFLPAPLQPISNFIFLTWSANLVRASFSQNQIEDWPFQIFLILFLGVIAGIIGHWILNRMISRLMATGKVSIL